MKKLIVTYCTPIIFIPLQRRLYGIFNEKEETEAFLENETLRQVFASQWKATHRRQHIIKKEFSNLVLIATHLKKVFKYNLPIYI